MNKLKSKLSLKISIPENKINAPIKNIKNECNHIIDNIYLSNYKSSLDKSFLISNNFTHIINCAYGSKLFTPSNFSEIIYYNIDLKDDEDVNLTNIIINFINFLKEVSQNKNNKILIHCAEGVSRSPALVSAYIMWKCNMDSLSAINYVKSKRNCIDINIGFLFQLNNLNLHREIFQQIF